MFEVIFTSLLCVVDDGFHVEGSKLRIGIGVDVGVAPDCVTLISLDRPPPKTVIFPDLDCVDEFDETVRVMPPLFEPPLLEPLA